MSSVPLQNHELRICIATVGMEPATRHTRRTDQSVMLLPRGTRRETLPIERLRVLEREVQMAKYLVQVGYTPEAWALPGRGPHNVMERVQSSAEALGGSIESLYFCFGDFDLLGIVDLPDARGVASWSMAVSSGGGVRTFKTTTLLSVEEGLQALGRASQLARAQRPLNAQA